MNKLIAAVLAAAALTAIDASAQPRTYTNMQPFRSEARLNTYYFDNFYQASNPALEEGVEAAAVEYRGAYRPKGSRTDYYGHLTYMWWNGTELVGSYGGRLGIANDGDVHRFNVFVDRTANRPSFEIGHTYGRADTMTLSGEYSLRFTPNWEAGVEGRREDQDYRDETRRDNEFTGLGASIRYRGWGDVISPTVGFLNGSRSVPNNTGEEYDADDYYVELVSEAIRPLWLQLGYHSRGRDYSIGDPRASNFHREDTGPQITFVAAWRQNPQVAWTVYLARESVSSTVPNRDFTTHLVLVGVSYGF